MKAAIVLVFLPLLAQALESCAPQPNLRIQLDATITGGHTRYWQSKVTISSAVCHEVEKALKYETQCVYGARSHTCQCVGSWANEKGVTARIQAATHVVGGLLNECEHV
jgi:hypothetical protein